MVCYLNFWPGLVLTLLTLHTAYIYQNLNQSDLCSISRSYTITFSLIVFKWVIIACLSLLLYLINTHISAYISFKSSQMWRWWALEILDMLTCLDIVNSWNNFTDPKIVTYPTIVTFTFNQQDLIFSFCFFYLFIRTHV